MFPNPLAKPNVPPKVRASDLEQACPDETEHRDEHEPAGTRMNPCAHVVSVTQHGKGSKARSTARAPQSAASCTRAIGLLTRAPGGALDVTQGSELVEQGFHLLAR
jgi:hypothetical protein